MKCFGIGIAVAIVGLLIFLLAFTDVLHMPAEQSKAAVTIGKLLALLGIGVLAFGVFTKRDKL